MWPNARISVMGAQQAASVLTTVKRDHIESEGKPFPPADESAIRQPLPPGQRGRTPRSDPRQIRARRITLLLHRADLGRRDPRSGENARRARAGIVDGLQRAVRRAEIRDIPHVNRSHEDTKTRRLTKNSCLPIACPNVTATSRRIKLERRRSFFFVALRVFVTSWLRHAADHGVPISRNTPRWTGRAVDAQSARGAQRVQ